MQFEIVVLPTFNGYNKRKDKDEWKGSSHLNHKKIKPLVSKLRKQLEGKRGKYLIKNIIDFYGKVSKFKVDKGTKGKIYFVLKSSKDDADFVEKPYIWENWKKSIQNHFDHKYDTFMEGDMSIYEDDTLRVELDPVLVSVKPIFPSKRKSPPESANLFPAGFRRKGLDGNTWEVIRSGDNNRWNRISKK